MQIKDLLSKTEVSHTMKVAEHLMDQMSWFYGSMEKSSLLNVSSWFIKKPKSWKRKQPSWTSYARSSKKKNVYAFIWKLLWRNSRPRQEMFDHGREMILLLIKYHSYYQMLFLDCWWSGRQLQDWIPTSRYHWRDYESSLPRDTADWYCFFFRYTARQRIIITSKSQHFIRQDTATLFISHIHHHYCSIS